MLERLRRNQKFTKAQSKSITILISLFVATSVCLILELDFLMYYLNICTLFFMSKEIYKICVAQAEFMSHWALVSLAIMMVGVTNFMWYFYTVAVVKIQEYEYQFLFMSNLLAPMLIFGANAGFFIPKIIKEIKNKPSNIIDIISTFLYLFVFFMGLLRDFDYHGIFYAPAPFAYFFSLVFYIITAFVVLSSFWMAETMALRRSMLFFMMASLSFCVLGIYDSYNNIYWIGSGDGYYSLPYAKTLTLSLQIPVFAIFVLGAFELYNSNKRIRKDDKRLTVLANWLPPLIIIPTSLLLKMGIEYVFFIIFVLTCHVFISHYAKTNLSSKEMLEKEQNAHEGLKKSIQASSSQQALANLKLRDMLNKDHLTGLNNRNFLLYELNNMLRTRDFNLALYYINIQKFKLINRAYGHLVGDRILKAVAKVLIDENQNLNNLEENPDYILAHFGADEFVLVKKVSDQEEYENYANAILSKLSEPIFIDNHKFFISFKIGASILLAHDIGTNIEQASNTLLKNADKALHFLKDSDKSAICFYSANIEEKANEKIKIELMLRNANLENEFELYFQPVFDLKSMKISSAEALLRWNNEEGLVEAKDFLNIAQTSDLGLDLCSFSAKRTIELISSWQNQCLPVPKIGINIMYQQVTSPTFIHSIRAMLLRNCIRPEFIEIELLEKLWAQPKAVLDDIFNSLKSSNISVCIDEFGVGYSSLSYIKNYGIDRIKIARSLISDESASLQKEQLISSIVDIGNILGIKTTAKGVSAQFLPRLKELGCSEAMGYDLAKPMNADDFASFLKQRQDIVISPV